MARQFTAEDLANAENALTRARFDVEIAGRDVSSSPDIEIGSEDHFNKVRKLALIALLKEQQRDAIKNYLSRTKDPDPLEEMPGS